MKPEEIQIGRPWVILGALIRKNAMLLKRAPLRVLKLLFIPATMFYFTTTLETVLEDVFNASMEVLEPESSSTYYEISTKSPATIQPCRWYDVYGSITREWTSDCITLMYAPPDTSSIDAIDRIMAQVAASASLSHASIANQTTTSSSADFRNSPFAAWNTDVVGFRSLADISKFMAAHHGRVHGVVHFQTNPDDGSDFRITVAVNETSFDEGTTANDIDPRSPSVVERILSSVSQSSLEILSGRKISATFKLCDFHSLTKTLTSGQSEEESAAVINALVRRILSQVAGILVTMGFTISQLMLILFINREKADGLFGALRSVGVQDSLLWLSWWCTALVINFGASILILIVAYSESIPFVSEGYWFLYLGFFMCVSMAIYSSLCLVISLFTQTKVVVSALMVAMLINFIFSCVFVDVGFNAPHSTSGAIYAAIFPCYHVQNFFTRQSFFEPEVVLLPDVPMNFNAYNTSFFFEEIGQCIKNTTDPTQPCQRVPFLEIPDDQDPRRRQRGDEPQRESDTSPAPQKIEYLDCHLDSFQDLVTAYQNQSLESENELQCAPENWYYNMSSDWTYCTNLLFQSLMYSILTWYCFNVVPSGNGRAKKPWFCFVPSYWLMDLSRRLKQLQENLTSSSEGTSSIQHQSLKNQSIEISQLSKRFNGNMLAVDQITMSIPHGEAFVLLGHNGAGKSTLINMLIGKHTSTSGEAFINGLSIKDDLSFIQQMIGVVPQHDILWHDLSAYDHLLLFSTIKGKGGLSSAQKQQNIHQILNHVHLSSSKDIVAGKYSGGMKRRLSIACSQIVEPAVLIMDEPTTGIDPYNRRRIWRLVEELKRDRVVLLTTHSMEEADVLSDYISIMDKGKIQANGTSLALKAQYGQGYIVEVFSEREDLVYLALNPFLATTANFRTKGKSAYTFTVSKAKEAILPKLTKILDESVSPDGIKIFQDWTVALSSLEDVFLTLAGKASAAGTEAQTTTMNQNENPLINVTTADPATTNDQAEDGEDHHVKVELQDEVKYTDVCGKSNFKQQLVAHITKLCRLQRYALIVNFLQLLLPVMCFYGLEYFREEMIEPDSGLLDITRVEVFPNGKVLNPEDINLYDGSTLEEERSSCAFQWKYTDQPSDPLSAVTIPAQIEHILKYGMSRKPVGQNDFHLQIDVNLTNMATDAKPDITSIERAINQVILSELQESKATENLNSATAYCQESGLDPQPFCGACFWDRNGLSAKQSEKDANIVHVKLPVSIPFTSFGMQYKYQCQTNFEFCSTSIISQVIQAPTFEQQVRLQLSNQAGGQDFTLLQLGRLVTRYASEFESDIKSEFFVVNGQNYDLGRSMPAWSIGNTTLWISGSNDNVDTSYFAPHFNRIRSFDNIDKVQDAIKEAQQSSYAMETYVGEKPNWEGCIANLPFRTFSSTFQRYAYNMINSDPVPISSINMTNLAEKWNAQYPSRAINIEELSVNETEITLSVEMYDYLKPVENPGGVFFGTYNVPYFHAVLVQPYCSAYDAENATSCKATAKINCTGLGAVGNWYDDSQYLSRRQELNFRDDINALNWIESVWNFLWYSLKAQVPDAKPLLLRFDTLDLLESPLQVEYEAATSSWEFIFCTVSIVVSTLFLFPSIVLHLKSEKEDRLVLLMHINNVNMATYYLSTWLFFGLLGFLVFLVTLVIGVCMSSQPLLHDANYLNLIVVGLAFQYVLFAQALLIHVVPMSRNLLMALCYILVLGCFLMPIFLLSPDITDYETFTRLPFYYHFTPPISFARAIFLCLWGRLDAQILEIVVMFFVTGSVYGALGIHLALSTGIGATRNVLPEFIMDALPTLTRGLTQRLSDCCSFSASRKQRFVNPTDLPSDDTILREMQVDVDIQAKRALDMEPTEGAIVIRKLCKTYSGSFQAVKDMSLSMHYGECFGLLGPNGAGKTTAISMLVGQFPPTSGQMFINGYDTSIDRSLATQSLGIVPQFDVLYEDLTVQQHLEFYAALKGYVLSFEIF